MEAGFDYLASPYTHASPLEREHRYLAAAHALRQFLEAKIWIYSPIVHCHELAKVYIMPKEASFWKEYNFAMIRAGRRLRILRLPGWDNSVGVKEEIAYAIQLGKPLIYHNPEALFDAAATVEIYPDQPEQTAA